MSQSDWPEEPTEKAYYGVAGEIAHAIEPHTEADEAAILIQFFVAFGNLIGRAAHYQVEADKHYTNLFALLVGDSSKARKGTSWGHVKRIFGELDPDWLSDRLQTGLSSGEGLIWAVRDQEEEEEETNTHKTYTVLLTRRSMSKAAKTPEDKRLMVVESEFASVLRILGRDGNTLSPTIRQAWDSGDLNNLTKNTPAKATGAHISIVGHITLEELKRYLDRTEMGNGFANRHLFACVRRSKCLPEGGSIDSIDFEPMKRKLGRAIKFARIQQRLCWDDEARTLWHSIYSTLSASKLGLFGSVVARSEAQVVRLAVLYALLDCSDSISRDHLEAAMALWKFCEDSARYAFGDSLGNPLADELRTILRDSGPNGLTRTEIRDHFRRHRKGSEIDGALRLLKELGLARFQPEQTGGRSTERWFACKGAT